MRLHPKHPHITIHSALSTGEFIGDKPAKSSGLIRSCACFVVFVILCALIFLT